MNNKIYDILKWVATILLPAINTLWLTLGQVWAFPYLEQIGATIAGVDVFIGALIGLSSKAYNNIEIIEDDFEDGEDYE